MIDASRWKDKTFNADYINMNPLERVQKLLAEAEPAYEFGFPTPEELDEWIEKEWVVLPPAEFPQQLLGMAGFVEKDGCVWFRGHCVAARPKERDKAIRRAEMDALEARWENATQRTARGTKPGVTVEDHEEVRQAPKRRGRTAKNAQTTA